MQKGKAKHQKQQKKKKTKQKPGKLRTNQPIPSFTPRASAASKEERAFKKS